MKNKVSVLISVYKNATEYFKAAIKSIQDQTHSNWEMIIVNDGDIINDCFYQECIDELSDKRIIYISNQVNQGISVCLNQAMQIASGEFIARMDSDDISLPIRFEKQIEFFNSHPESNILGTYAIEIGDKHDYLIDYNNYSQKMRSILLMFRNSGLIHPSVMIRRKFLYDNGIRYDEGFSKAQDYRLWVQCTKYSKMDCLNEILFLYRRHFSQISACGKVGQDNYSDQIRILQLCNLLDSFNESEKELHLKLCNRDKELDIQSLFCWCSRLIKANNEKNIYNHFLLKGILFSESLTIVFKRRKDFQFLSFCKKTIQFISVESASVWIYMKCIHVNNNIRKKIFPIYQKKIQFIHDYEKQLTKK